MDTATNIFLSSKLGEVSIHKDICDEIHKLWKAKNSDYGNSYDKTRDEYGSVAPLIRIDDKLNRLKQLTRNGDPKVNESIEDTLMDLAGYAILEILYLRKHK